MTITKMSKAYSTISANSGIAGEKNDCVVRAFSLTLNKEYSEIHADCKTFGRKDKRGTFDNTVHAVAKKHNMTEVVNVNRDGNKICVSHFIAQNPVGKFYVHRRGHAFSIIDGVVHDWANGTGARSQITLAFKV